MPRASRSGPLFLRYSRVTAPGCHPTRQPSRWRWSRDRPGRGRSPDGPELPLPCRAPPCQAPPCQAMPCHEPCLASSIALWGATRASGLCGAIPAAVKWRRRPWPRSGRTGRRAAGESRTARSDRRFPVAVQDPDLTRVSLSDCQYSGKMVAVLRDGSLHPVGDRGRRLAAPGHRQRRPLPRRYPARRLPRPRVGCLGTRPAAMSSRAPRIAQREQIGSALSRVLRHSRVTAPGCREARRSSRP